MRTRRSDFGLVAFVVGIAVLGCSPHRIAGQASVARLFWGSATVNDFGTQAVVLCLNELSNGGQLFVPPLMAQLRDFERADQRIQFKTEPVDDRVRSFDVHLQGSELTGTGQQLDLQGKEPTRTFALVAKQVTPTADGIRQPSLVFSNARTIAETGDFIGEYLEIVLTSEGDRGLIVFYDSPWYEEEDFPYYLFDITRSEKTIRFQTQTPKGRVKYHVDLDGSGARLWRDDETIGGFPMRTTKPVTACGVAAR